MASLSTAQMREALSKLYPNSRTWKNNVNRWPTKQVQAVYFRFLEQDLFPSKQKV